jgi:hypothetical protein
MNKLLKNCSILPLGSRGYLIPTDRKNPRFPAGTKFEIKKRFNNGIFVKFATSNSIFGIMESEAEEILGLKLSEYLKEVDTLRTEGMKKLAQALVESGLYQVVQSQHTGEENES